MPGVLGLTPWRSLLLIVRLETGLRLGAGSPDTRYTLPQYSLGYFWDTPLGWTGVVDGSPVNRDSVQFASLAGFLRDEPAVPVPPEDNVYMRFAGYALVGSVLAPLVGTYASFVLVNVLFWVAGGAGHLRARAAPHQRRPPTAVLAALLVATAPAFAALAGQALPYVASYGLFVLALLLFDRVAPVRRATVAGGRHRRAGRQRPRLPVLRPVHAARVCRRVRAVPAHAAAHAGAGAGGDGGAAPAVEPVLADWRTWPRTRTTRRTPSRRWRRGSTRRAPAAARSTECEATRAGGARRAEYRRAPSCSGRCCSAAWELWHRRRTPEAAWFVAVLDRRVRARAVHALDVAAHPALVRAMASRRSTSWPRLGAVRIGALPARRRSTRP